MSKRNGRAAAVPEMEEIINGPQVGACRIDEALTRLLEVIGT